ncbi:hypothetical protein BSAF29S_04127 [Bacillus safensis subsp. safensis]
MRGELAHIGVLSSLEKQGIQVDMIAGSSIGALVGSFYAAGQDVEKMKKLALVFRRKYYADYTLPKIGLLKGKSNFAADSHVYIWENIRRIKNAPCGGCL